MKRKGQIIVGLTLILIFILMALAAPLLAPNDPNATDLALLWQVSLLPSGFLC